MNWRITDEDDYPSECMSKEERAQARAAERERRKQGLQVGLARPASVVLPAGTDITMLPCRVSRGYTPQHNRVRASRAHSKYSMDLQTAITQTITARNLNDEHEHPEWAAGAGKLRRLG